MDKQGTKNLVVAIIATAIRDRRQAKARLAIEPHDKEALEVEKDTREFFESAWYQNLLDYLDCWMPSDLLEII